MDIAMFKKHTVTECNCCGSLMWAENTTHDLGHRQTGDVSELYREHLGLFPACKKWHDALPKLSDLCGILKESE